MAAKKVAAKKKQGGREGPSVKGPPAKAPGPTGLVIHKAVTLLLSVLVFATYNPRVMPAAKMRALKASLIKHGLVLNLVVQRRSDDGTEYVVIGGHQRVTAMRELCAERGWVVPLEVEVVVLDVDDATAKQLNVALNRIEGEFDPHKLGEVFESIHLGLTGEDTLAMGFLDGEVLELRGLLKSPEERADELEREAGEGLGGFARSITLTVEFDTVERRNEVKVALDALAKDRKVKPGVLLAEAVQGMKLRSRPPTGRQRKAPAPA